MSAAPAIPSLADRVDKAVTTAIRQVLPAVTAPDAIVRRSAHADFQANAALGLAGAAGTRPAELARNLAAAVDTDGVLSAVSVSGPGFLNLTVADAALWASVAARDADPRLGAGTPYGGSRTVIDYSAPNIAKEMHVGHLRGTIIGDALARILGFLGADVVRQNHLGDWGTQFGKLIAYLAEHPGADWHHADDPAAGLAALGTAYKKANALFETDPAFAGRSRASVVALQAGDPGSLAVWRELVAVSTRAFEAVYDRLGVLLTPGDYAGESAYNDDLDGVIAELTAAGIAVESDGAVCVFSETETGTDGSPVPLIVRKADGGYGYAATDLATIRHRAARIAADRVLYVVDARQALHFRMVFETARRAGWLDGGVDVVHVAYGTILGPDGRPYKTRSGDTVKLTALLDAAVHKALSIVEEKNPGMPAGDAARLAEQAGIGAVKYADLSTSLTKDYAFDVERMVSLTGDTGVYLQYAHTRMRAILRKAGERPSTVDTGLPPHPAERALALHLDGYASALTETAANLEPHRLCGYLYALARAFTGFYENCPVLTAETDAARGNRLALVRLSARTLHHGLGLLGIGAPERM